MSWSYEHLKWLVDTGEKLRTVCGKDVPIYRFNHDVNDQLVMVEWARHFRNHYCADDEIEEIKSPELTNSEYLVRDKFPHATNKPGPSIRAGDFAEILIADFLQFLRGYYVPRTRYDRKIIANESSKGSDVIAFKKAVTKNESDDELLIFEVKAKVSEKSPVNILQTAIDDSAKDESRLAESLNAMKQRLRDKQDKQGVAVVDRFQRNLDRPYKRLYGAGGVVTQTSYSPALISQSSTNKHPSANALELLVIAGDSLMPLVHALYQRAADEA